MKKLLIRVVFRLKKCLTCVRCSCSSCAVVLDRSKFEEDHGFHLEVDEVVDGSVFACLRLLASLSQK